MPEPEKKPKPVTDASGATSSSNNDGCFEGFGTVLERLSVMSNAPDSLGCIAAGAWVLVVVGGVFYALFKGIRTLFRRRT